MWIEEEADISGPEILADLRQTETEEKYWLKQQEEVTI